MNTNQRNPNLSIPEVNQSSLNQVQKQFGSSWWTGLAPEECLGFSKTTQVLHSLPLLNLDICTRADVLAAFNNGWTLTELLFQCLKDESTYVRSPYHQLRHPPIFYYGHPAVLYWNKLRLSGLVHGSIDLYLEKVLETGVDEMSWDDMSKNEMAWPSVAQVHAYRKKVYDKIVELIQTHPALDEKSTSRNLGPSSPLWALFMGIEHDNIHLETSSVLFRELPLNLVERPRFFPDLHPSASINTKPNATPLSWVQVAAQSVTVGKSKNTPSYGWDNEYGSSSFNLKSFSASETLISNAQFYPFVQSLAYVNDKYWTAEGARWRKFRNSKRPCFWVAHGPEGLHDYKLRTLFNLIDMPWDWPAEVNFHEAQAYSKWLSEKDNSKVQYRLLSEAEHHALRDQASDEVLQTSRLALKNFKANFNLQFSSPWPVQTQAKNSKGFKDVFGNVWQWLEDHFHPLEGFELHPLYDDFSQPCFDGNHQMIMGGSFISCGHEASVYARFHFRPHFFQHAGFRLAYSNDGSAQNGAVFLTKDLSKVDGRSPKTAREVMQTESWWQNYEQPMELSAEALKPLWNSTQESIIAFEKNRNSMNPAGLAHSASDNKLRSDFKLLYQTATNFPERPENLNELLKLLNETIVPTGQIPGHPGYMAYVAGAGNPISQMAQALSQTYNQFTGHHSLSPGLVQLEEEVIGWLLKMVGYDKALSSGFLTTGGSLANLSALSFARAKVFKSYDYAKARFYASTEAHHCIAKALHVLGFPTSSLVHIPVDENFHMRISALKTQIAQDIKEGFTPVCIIGTAGSTQTGSVDSLEEIAKVAQEFKVWFHVDAAYGGFFMLTDEGQEKLKGINLADSIALDPHKSLSIPYGTGGLLVKNKTDMKYEYRGSTSYMPPSPGLDGEHLDFADLSPELSRDARGLRIWLPLRFFGVAPFQLNLEEKLKLSHHLTLKLNQIPGVQLLKKPDLSITNFCLKTNELTQKLVTAINESQTLFLTTCTLQDRLYIRVCLLGFRTHFKQVEELLALITHESKRLNS